MKRLAAIAGLVWFSLVLMAQAPGLFNYQTAIRRADGVVISNTAVSLTINVRKNTADGVIVCSEVHNRTTNPQGIVTLAVGSVNLVDFGAIDWTDGPYFIEVIYGGISMGVNRLLSTPYAIFVNYADTYDETDPVFLAHVSSGINGADIANWNAAFGWGNHAGLYLPVTYNPAWADITGKPITVAGYGITDAMTTAHPANAITAGNITNWNTAYGWGDHAGLYRPITYEPTWAEITSKPTTLAGYGITDAMSTSHPANAIAAGDISNWNTAYGWGNHAGLYRPVTYYPTWAEVTGKPSFAAVATSGSYNDISGKPVGSASGDLQYWDGSAIDVIPIGLPGQFLRINTAYLPEWMGDAFATLTTAAITGISTTTATSGGNITNAGGGIITERGVCFSTSPNPTVSSDKTADGGGSGTFVSNMTGLSMNTTYYVRAYAINGAGPAYGNELSFTTFGTPTVLTAEVTGIGETTATSGGNVTSDGGSAVTARGVCWNTTGSPTTADSKTTNGSGTGSFVSSLTGLLDNTTYYVRAYATNAYGTSYGNEVMFTTSMVMDIDGNPYPTVQIGTQRWFARNLRVTTYTTGTIIPNLDDNTDWTSTPVGAYCWYNNDFPFTEEERVFGVLYNFYAVQTGNLCPTGWRVPTVADWNTLATYLSTNVGRKLKITGTVYWDPVNDADNSTGFSAVGAGYRNFSTGAFVGRKTLGVFCTSTDAGGGVANIRYMQNGTTTLISATSWYNHGNAVRCIKN